LETPNKYQELRENWINLRKNKSKNEDDVVLQKLLGLIIDKTTKMAKEAKSDDFNSFVEKAIKAEYKQQLDSMKQGINNRLELMILEELLPQTLSIKDTSKIVDEVFEKISSGTKPNMGLMMKELKTYTNLDMKIVSKLVQEKLKK